MLEVDEYIPIREPDKQPTTIEWTLSRAEGYPALLTAVQQLERGKDIMSQEIKD